MNLLSLPVFSAMQVSVDFCRLRWYLVRAAN
jgi:hypothetical protein